MNRTPDQVVALRPESLVLALAQAPQPRRRKTVETDDAGRIVKTVEEPA